MAGQRLATTAGVRVMALVAALWAWSAPAQVASDGVHLGVSTCANSACHGGAGIDPNSRIQRNEFTHWSANDPHAKSYRSLQSDRSKRITANLGLGPATGEGLCLGCHTDNVPQERRAISFKVEDGVGCEACHGGAVTWLGIHSTGLATRQQNLDAGLYPTEDPVKRAEMCLDCHFGAKDQFANHRLMGAGHPRISFELDTYTAVHAHHTVDRDYVERKNFVDSLRTWTIGAAMMVERRMTLLADDATGTNGFFPEFAFFDCNTCHHPMSQLRWQQRPGTGLPPGTPKLDDSHMQVLRIALPFADRGLAGEFDAGIRALHQAGAQGRAPLVAAATRMAGLADRAVVAMAAYQPTPDAMRAILDGLSEAAAEGRLIDYAAAEQATLVIGATISAMHQTGAIDGAGQDRLFAQLDRAYAAVENDEKFQPQQFVEAMRGLKAALN